MIHPAKCVFRLLLAVVCVVSPVAAEQFGKATYYRAGLRPSQVVTADFNNDGNLDLAMADWLSNQVVVLLGNGDGTFQKPLIFSAPSPTDLAAADLDGDGSIDLAVTESDGSGPGALVIYLGNGNGRFSLKSKYKLGDYAGVVKIADFNQDGIPDIATGDEGTGSSGVVRIFMGMGKAKFRKPATYQVGAWLDQLATGDLSGNQYPDIAVTEAMAGNVAVFINDGTGHFGKPAIYSTGGLIGDLDIRTADLRNNGMQDLVVAALSQGMIVLLNNGNGTFGNYSVYQPNFNGWQPPEACTIADFNLDGILDVACTPQIDDAYVFYGVGDGTFHAGVEINDAFKKQGGFSIASGDFNNDGSPDLAIPIQSYGKVAIMINAK